MEGSDVDIPRASADTSAQVAESQLILSIGFRGVPILTPFRAGEGIPKDCQVDPGGSKDPCSRISLNPAAGWRRCWVGPAPRKQKRALFLAVRRPPELTRGVLRIIDLAKSGIEDLEDSNLFRETD